MQPFCNHTLRLPLVHPSLCCETSVLISSNLWHFQQKSCRLGAVFVIYLYTTSRGPQIWQLFMLFPDSVNYLKTKYFQVCTTLNLVVQRRLVKSAGLQFYSKVSMLQHFKFFFYAFTAQTWKEITAPWVKIIRTRSEKHFLHLSLTLKCQSEVFLMF